jgi:hypothetical protein
MGQFSSVLDERYKAMEQKLRKKKQRALNKMNGRLQTIMSHFFFKWKLLTQLSKMSTSISRVDKSIDLPASHRRADGI